MNTKNQTWYGFFALGVAAVVILLVVWMVKSPSIQSTNSKAGSVVCIPTDIIELIRPNGGESFGPGDVVEIKWAHVDNSTSKLPTPVPVNLFVTSIDNPGAPGHCQSTSRNQYTIATGVMSVPGSNGYTWEIPKDYPISATGDNLVIKVSTQGYIGGRQNTDMSDGLISIIGNY